MCNNCGECCRRMNSPPGYVYLITCNPANWPDQADVSRLKSMPLPVFITLLSYIKRLDSVDDSEPCIWLDQETNKCKHYDWRPEICRSYNCK